MSGWCSEKEERCSDSNLYLIAFYFQMKILKCRQCNVEVGRSGNVVVQNVDMVSGCVEKR